MDMIVDAKTMGGVVSNPVMEQFKEMCPDRRVEDGVVLQIIEAMLSPRVIKDHYPLSLLPRDILQRAKVS